MLKPAESVLRLMPDVDRAYPYEGSKALMVIVDDVENAELMETVLNMMYEELPRLLHIPTEADAENSCVWVGQLPISDIYCILHGSYL